MIELIFANPVVQIIQQTGTEVVTDHASCETKDLQGAYYLRDGVRDLMIICVDNNYNASSLADTIRHEAIHVVQACYGGTVFDKDVVLKYASEEDFNDIKKYYPVDKYDHELEAFVGAKYLNEQHVVDLIDKYCLY